MFLQPWNSKTGERFPDEAAPIFERFSSKHKRYPTPHEIRELIKCVYDQTGHTMQFATVKSWFDNYRVSLKRKPSLGQTTSKRPPQSTFRIIAMPKKPSRAKSRDSLNLSAKTPTASPACPRAGTQRQTCLQAGPLSRLPRRINGYPTVLLDSLLEWSPEPEDILQSHQGGTSSEDEGDTQDNISAPTSVGKSRPCTTIGALAEVIRECVDSPPPLSARPESAADFKKLWPVVAELIDALDGTQLPWLQ
ncbi:hypothetical protein NMY22_g328 [Coprinellus aureogranulatus]|nr:hypothetical protein NMY22_g328 [Coprinellus aureogranulatus]